MFIVTASQMQAAEKAANASGLSYEQMMENAGHAVAEAIAARFDISEVRVLVLAGPGNNGGDGLVAARYLSQLGATVTVYGWKRKTAGDKNWALLDAAGVEKILSGEYSVAIWSRDGRFVLSSTVKRGQDPRDGLRSWYWRWWLRRCTVEIVGWH